MPDALPQTLEPLLLTISADKVARYAALTADYNPIHLDAAFAAATPFGVPIAHGTASLGLVLLCVERSVGAGWIVSDVDIRFSRPVPVGQTVVAGGELSGDRRDSYHVFVDTGTGARALEGSVRLAAISAAS